MNVTHVKEKCDTVLYDYCCATFEFSCPVSRKEVALHVNVRTSSSGIPFSANQLAVTRFDLFALTTSTRGVKTVSMRKFWYL